MKKISVIIPCFNQGPYLDETLQSVLNQTYPNWECIIINDGSTDNTEVIAKEWINQDQRFVYVYKVNGGLSSARNSGLNVATGHYIQLLDADDLIKPTKFELQLQDLQKAQISISNYFSFIDGNKEQPAKHRYLSPFLSEIDFKKEVILDWEYRKSIPCHAVLFEKQLIDTHRLRFDEDLPNHEDWVFWVKLFYYSKGIKNRKEVLALYRIRTNAMSVDFKLMKSGFLKAAKNLEAFFKVEKQQELLRLTREKHKEVYNKNRTSIQEKIKSKIYSKLAYFYKYVKTN
ncbi:glycosyltransferase family 2 protein [Mariniflexile sp. AS56]|uniref:glycosyltransferase family 2 protein n=1 Tax=Mariniflexile sp. AS56 TaxID=3063957 RepID=UPI0026EFA885|nr:glycosyltransferase family 2 protein [Mariniflexile sp. AS56]MDO7172726.1 glycosyltransferase family 2 protein [Mariniflexile sp. AS56]